MAYSLEEEVQFATDIAYLNNKPEEFKWLIGKNYNEFSFIFRITNELISAKEYVETIKDKNKVLSVIASGDQILNSILFGSKDIDAFDISIFPKHYLKLKLAAIESLDCEDYKEFFFGKDALNKKVYKSFSDKLDPDSKFFWDSLMFLQNKKGQLATSDLFCTDHSCLMYAEEINPYMEPSNYKDLKSKIKNFNLRLFQGDIFDLKEELTDSYDLVNLSSIIVSTNTIPPTFDVQKEILKGFNINKNGRVLSYIFDMDFDKSIEGWMFIPNDDDYWCTYLHDDKGKAEDAILVYKKM